MIESFSDIVSKMKYHLQHKEDGFSIPLAPKFNGMIGNILPAQYTVVAGMQSAGKTSFVDQNYVLNLLLQREAMQEKIPLKIFYFSLKDTSLKKFQSLLCCYSKLVHNLRIDIPTLNSQPGRIFDIDTNVEALHVIDEAEVFFNSLLEDEVLTVIPNINKPTAIYTYMSDYLISIKDDDEKPFIMMVVDSTDHLVPESDGFRTIQGAELDYKFDNYITQLVREFNIHAVIVTPAHGANSRYPKENEPNYKQLSAYGRNCDKGVILYNPIAENNNNYLRSISDYTCYVSAQGLNTLRFWHVVRNVDGVDSCSERLLFLPGTGYMIEIPMTNEISDFLRVKELLYNTDLNKFYKPPVVEDATDE